MYRDLCCMQGIPDIGESVFGSTEVMSRMILLAKSEDTTAKVFVHS